MSVDIKATQRRYLLLNNNYNILLNLNATHNYSLEHTE